MCVHQVRRKVMIQKTVLMMNYSRFFIIFLSTIWKLSRKEYQNVISVDPRFVQSEAA